MPLQICISHGSEDDGLVEDKWTVTVTLQSGQRWDMYMEKGPWW